MRIFQACLRCAVLLAVMAAPAAAQETQPRLAPRILAGLLANKLNPLVRLDVKAAIDAAEQAYAAAATAHALQPDVETAVIRARAAAEKAENNFWGYGVSSDALRRYAGETNEQGLPTGAGVADYRGFQDMGTLETDGRFGKLVIAAGGYIAGDMHSTPHPNGEYLAPDGSRYAGEFSAVWLPFTAEGFGVLDGAGTDAQSQRAGAFRGNLLNGYGVLVMKDGSMAAGKWWNGKQVGYWARFDAQGRVTDQGPALTGIFDHPVPGLTLPASVSLRDCNKDFYPVIAQRLGEQGDVEVAFTVGPDGRPVNPAIWGSNGAARLENGAINCVSAWRYTPAKMAGRPVNYLLHTVVQMRILHPITAAAPVP